MYAAEYSLSVHIEVDQRRTVLQTTKLSPICAETSRDVLKY